jgi:GNAT superfamily N-acetyltransferase
VTRAEPLDVKPLTKARVSDLATLFGEGGDPKWCWCAYWRVRNVDFQTATPAGNREVLERSLRSTSADGRAPGLIAYEAGEPIGWVSVGPRADYERLTYSRVLAPVDDEEVWSVVCFVVSRRARGRGVASTLLDAAVDYARRNGAKWLEAYPAETDGGRISAASAYKGTLSMFEKAGFEVVVRRRANRASPERPIVRRRL